MYAPLHLPWYGSPALVSSRRCQGKPHGARESIRDYSTTGVRLKFESVSSLEKFLFIAMPHGTSRMMMDGEAMTKDGEMTTLEDMKGDLEKKTDDR